MEKTTNNQQTETKEIMINDPIYKLGERDVWLISALARIRTLSVFCQAIDKAKLKLELSTAQTEIERYINDIKGDYYDNINN